jgi:hypothetical protein
VPDVPPPLSRECRLAPANLIRLGTASAPFHLYPLVVPPSILDWISGIKVGLDDSPSMETNFVPRIGIYLPSSLPNGLDFHRSYSLKGK